MVAVSAMTARSQPAKAEYYKLIVYHFASDSQQVVLDNYLRDSFVPSLHQLGFKNIGCFKPITNDTVADKKLVVLLAASRLEQLIAVSSLINRSGKPGESFDQYMDAAYNHAPYLRIETILLSAFRLAPAMKLPALKSARKDHIYELRSYESPTEKLYANKVQMFNEGGEISLFKRLNFNAVFYANVISGSRMPNLMYMTSFENIEDREAHWKTFSADPEWKRLSSLPEYQHNVSHADIILMRATGYSDY